MLLYTSRALKTLRPASLLQRTVPLTFFPRASVSQRATMSSQSDVKTAEVLDASELPVGKMYVWLVGILASMLSKIGRRSTLPVVRCY